MLFQADMQRASEYCLQALEKLPEDEHFVRSIVDWISNLIKLIGGDLQDSKQILKDIARTNLETGNILIAVVALCHRAKLQMRQGRLYRAKETLEQALQIATDPLGRWLPVASEALLLLGDIEREWNNLDKALNYLNKSIEQARKWSELAAFDSYYPLARVRLAQGDVSSAREAIETARQIADKSEGTQIDDLVADLQQAVFLAGQGDFTNAMQWAERRGLIPITPPEATKNADQRQDTLDARLLKYERLVLGRLLVLQGRSSEALNVLGNLLELARQLERTDMIIEIQILRALAFQAVSDNTRALNALTEALTLAEPGGFIRIFIDEGEPMVRLLKQAASYNVSPDYTAKLLAACGETDLVELKIKHSSSPTQSLIEPLSGRELDVLRLLATGMSNPEIADELIIAVSTVNSHCKSIYSKLGVHKRWDAVQRGKELDLIK
jgi:LuxR family maltose regulon positive regulatory protein